MSSWASFGSEGFQIFSQRPSLFAVPSQPWRNMRADLEVEDSVSSKVVAA